MAQNLTKPPVVRRIVYIDSYLEGVKMGLDQEELEVKISETKKILETEKALAVGRGNPFRKDMKKSSNLTYDCNRIVASMKLITGEPLLLTALGERYVASNNIEKKKIICEQFSWAYPHFGVLVTTLECHGTLVLPMRNQPPFRPEIKKYGVNTHQVAFDTIRDLATDVGLVNWYTKGRSEERRQYVYLACHRAEQEIVYKVFHEDHEIHFSPNSVSREKFRKTLWENYIDYVHGIPGAPVFYSVLRELVCNELTITDEEFNKQTMDLVEYDDQFNVIWSQGVLPRKLDSASMLKSLPPKNEDGNYIIFLKIVRR